MRFPIKKTDKHKWLVAFCVICALIPGSSIRAETTPPKASRVLLVFSFNMAYAQQYRLATSFQQSLSLSGQSYWINQLELDTLENPEPAQWQQRLNVFLPDIRQGQYDVIVAFGDNALNLLRRNFREIPQHVSIVFCGQELLDRQILTEHPNITGVVQQVDPVANIKLGLQLFPATRQIILLTNWTPVGKQVQKLVAEAATLFPSVKMIFIDNENTTSEEMLREVAAAGPNSLVLFYGWFNRRAVNFASLQYLMLQLEDLPETPCLVMHDAMLRYQNVGGVMVRAGQLGEKAAKITAEVLKGKRAGDIPVTEVPRELMLNWQALQHYRIAEKRLPPNAVLVGKPTSFWQAYPKEIIAGGSIALSLLLIFTTALLFLIRRKHAIQKDSVIYHNLPLAFFVFDLRGNILLYEPGNHKIAPVETLRTLYDIPGIDHQLFRQKIADALVPDGATPLNYEYRQRKYTGTFSRLPDAIYRKPAVIFISQDTTLLQKSREEARRTAEHFLLTLKSIGDAVIVTDENSRITMLNHVAARLTGHDENKAVGLPLQTVCKIEPNDAETAEEPLDEYPVLISDDGRRHPITCSIAPVFGVSGQEAGKVLVIHDVSREDEQKQQLREAAMLAQEASRAKSYFLATMSHELRTPLNAVIGFSELLQCREAATPEEAEYLKAIHTAGNRLLDQINDILDISRIEAAQLKIDSDGCDIPDLIHEVSDNFSSRIAEKNLALHLELQEDFPRLLLDANRLRQVLIHLVENAVKFTNQGTISLQAKFTPDDEQSGRLEINVLDTGIGVKPEFSEKIFLPFERQRDTGLPHQESEGSGLGLTISRRLATKLGGTLQLQSREEGGSMFKLLFEHVGIGAPISPAKNAQTVAREIPPGTKVLVVDDIPLNIKVLEAMLKKLGLESRSATSGAQALEQLQTYKPDLILTDMWMPEMNGSELLTRLRMIPGFDDIPVIAITADMEHAVNFDLNGFAAVLLKPCSLGKLRGLLKELLSEYGKHPCFSSSAP